MNIAHNWIPGDPLPWSAKYSPLFEDTVYAMAGRLGMPPEGPVNLVGCMAWESDNTFSPHILNKAGSGAIGLIQFMPDTARGLGTSSSELARMAAVEQLAYVEKYFRPYRGRLNNLGDVYMAILWPAGIGKSDDWVLWNKDARPTTYRQNAGLDYNKDGNITRGECVKKVRERLEEGFLPQNMRK